MFDVECSPFIVHRLPFIVLLVHMLPAAVQSFMPFTSFMVTSACGGSAAGKWN
jgi:hypothetical protein